MKLQFCYSWWMQSVRVTLYFLLLRMNVFSSAMYWVVKYASPAIYCAKDFTKKAWRCFLTQIILIRKMTCSVSCNYQQEFLQYVSCFSLGHIFDVRRQPSRCLTHSCPPEFLKWPLEVLEWKQCQHVKILRYLSCCNSFKAASMSLKYKSFRVIGNE